MKKLRLAFVVILVATLFAGCASTKTFTTSWMTSRLQNALDASGAMKPIDLKMKVENLKIVKTGLNTYTGTATFSWTGLDGSKQIISDAPIDVFTDGTTFIYRFPTIFTDPYSIR